MHDAEYTVDDTTGCWLWQKCLRNGYGRVWRDGKLVSAHIWFWEQDNGPVPEGMDLDHTCHNKDETCAGGNHCVHRSCVNPAHLEPVTRATNVRRGRLTKLSKREVAEIKARPEESRKVLAAEFGVGRDLIAAIRAGHVWGDVGVPHVKREVLGPPVVSRRSLTEREIAEIRAAPRYPGSGRELAHRYGVSDALISRVRLRG